MILCVFSHVLGNRTLSALVERAVAASGHGAHAAVALDTPAYQRFPAPPLLRRVAPLETVLVTRALVADWRARAPLAPVRALVATTWEAFVAARAVLPGVPALVALDGTPRNALELPPLAPARLPRRVVKLAVERAASARLRHEVGRGPARFLPMSRWAARSLARDYGVRPDHAEPMHTPIDTAWWTPGPGASAGGPPDLLFVGNDFARKGGETLLAAYERFLAPDYTLTVVSTDAVLRGRPLPAGVTLVPGITGEPLRALYRRAACFVLPTLRDHSPWVVAEAQAAGLPVVTADVGGVGDLVVEAETGFVLPRGSPPEAWARAVRAAVDDRSRHAAMREAARRHAEAAFGLERFHARVRAELGALLAG